MQTEIYPDVFVRYNPTLKRVSSEIFYHKQWIPLSMPIDRPQEEHYMGWCSACFVGELLVKS